MEKITESYTLQQALKDGPKSASEFLRHVVATDWEHFEKDLGDARWANAGALLLGELFDQEHLANLHPATLSLYLTGAKALLDRAATAKF